MSSNVLVVDDNTDAADSLAMLLELEGYSVQVAYEGTHAMTVLKTFVPDAAVLDLDIPGINGFELATRIRGRLGPGVCLIALSAWWDDEANPSMQTAFDHFLLKPADIEELLPLLVSADRSPEDLSPIHAYSDADKPTWVRNRGTDRFGSFTPG